MEQPLFQATGGIFTLYWKSVKTRIRIDRVREVRDVLSGEITIHIGNPEKWVFILRDRISLLNSSHRQRVIKEAHNRRNEIEWYDMVIMACERAVDKYREGEVVTDAGDKPISAKPKFLLYPLLVYQEVNLLYGDGSTCKSYLANLLGLSLLTGESLVKTLRPIESNIKTLVLDFETNFTVWNDRVQKLKTGMTIDSGTLKYRHCHQSVTSDIETIHQIVIDNQIQFVVVDSYGMACGGDAWSQVTARDYFMALRSLGVTTLTVDHITKDKSKPGPFGSAYKPFESRNVWRVKAMQQQEEDVVQVALIHEKANDSRLLNPLGLRFSFIEDEAVTVDEVDIKDIPGFIDDIPLQDRIAEVLKHGAMTIGEIAEEIGAKRESVKVKLYQNKKRFIIADMQGKKWGLLSESPRPGGAP